MQDAELVKKIASLLSLPKVRVPVLHFVIAMAGVYSMIPTNPYSIDGTHGRNLKLLVCQDDFFLWSFSLKSCCTLFECD